MKKIFALIAILFGFLIFSGLMFFVIFRSRLVILPVRDYISAKVEELTGQKTCIGGISTNYFNKITVRDFEVCGKIGKDQKLASIEEIMIHLNLLKMLFSANDFSKVLKGVEICRPVIYMSEDNLDIINEIIRKNEKNTASAGPADISWDHGSVVFENDLYSLTDASGYYLSGRESNYFKIMAYGAFGERIVFDVRNHAGGRTLAGFNVDFGSDSDGERDILKISDVAEKIAGIYLKKNLNVNSRLGDVLENGGRGCYVNGSVKAEITIKNDGTKQNGTDWDAHVEFDGFSINNKNDVSIGALDGAVEISSQKLLFGDLGFIIRDSLEFGVKGFINDPFDKGLMNIELEGLNKFPLGTVNDNIALNCLSNLKGELFLSFSLKGSYSEPVLEGTLSSRSLDTGWLEATTLFGNFKASGGKYEIINFEFYALNGKVGLSGSLADKTAFGKLKITGLDLGRLKTPDNFPEISGVINMSADLYGNLSNPKLKGKVYFSGMTVSGREIGAGEGVMELGSGRFRIEASNMEKEFNAVFECSYGEGIMDVESLHLGFGSSLFASAKGSLNFITREIDSEIRLEGFRIDEISFLRKELKNYSGNFSFSGNVKGFIYDPLIIGRLSAVNMADKKLTDKSNAVSVVSEISYGNEQIMIPMFEIEDLCSGWISVYANYKDLNKIMVKGGLKFVNGSLRKLGSLANNAGLNGKINGTVDFEYNPVENHESFLQDKLLDNVKSGLKKMFNLDKTGMFGLDVGMDVSAESVNFSGFEADSLFFRGSIKNGLLKIEKAGIVQKDGLAEFNGGGDFRYVSGDYSFGLESKQLKYGESVFDGSLDITGKYNCSEKLSFHGTVDSPSWWINGIRAGSFSGEYGYSEKKLKLEKVRWGKLLKGGLELEMEDYSKIKLKGDFISDLDDIEILKNLSPIEVNLPVKGPARQKVSIGGYVGEPEVDFDFKLENDRWNDFIVNSEGSGSLSEGIFYIDNMDVSIDYTTSLSLKGKSILADKKGLNLLVNIDKCDLGSVGGKLKYLKNAQGIAKGVVEISGNWDDPVVKGKITGEDIVFKNFQFDSIQTAFEYYNSSLMLDEFKLELERGSIFLEQGSLLKLADAGRSDFNITANFRDLDLGPVTIFGGAQFEGSMDFSEGFDADVAVRTKNLYVNQKIFEKDMARFFIKDNRVNFTELESAEYKLTGVVDFVEYPKVAVSGLNIRKNENVLASVDGFFGKEELDVEGRLKNLDADDIFGLLTAEISVSGSMSSEFVAKGRYSEPDVFANINIVNGKFMEMPFINANCQFACRENYITVSNFRIVKQDAFLLDLKGGFPLGRAEKTKGDINVDVELKDYGYSILKSVFPFVVSGDGALTSKLKIRGTKDDPKFWGYVNTSNGSIVSKRYFKNIKDLNMSCVLNDYNLDIKDISGNIGSGAVRVSGSMKLGWLNIENMNLKAQTVGDAGIAVTVPELSINATPLFGRLTQSPSKGSPKAYIEITGSSDKPNIAGWVELEDTYFTYPGEEDDYEDGKSELYSKFFDCVDWDVEIRSGENTWFENEYANLKIDGKVKIKRKEGFYEINSRIESAQGSVGYLGTEFEVDRMIFEVIPLEDMKFTGRVRNRAYLEGTARATLSRYNPQLKRNVDDEVKMTINRAPIAEIKPVFYSKNSPDLDSDKALILATGYDMSEMTADEKDLFLRRSLVQIIDATLTTPLAKKIVRNIGIIDTVSVSHGAIDNEKRASDDENGRSELLDTFLGTRYTVGKHFSSRLLLEYSVLVDELQNKLDLRHELALSYSLGRSLYIRGYAELDAAGAVRSERKAILEKQWRFK